MEWIEWIEWIELSHLTPHPKYAVIRAIASTPPPPSLCPQALPSFLPFFFLPLVGLRRVGRVLLVGGGGGGGGGGVGVGIDLVLSK